MNNIEENLKKKEESFEIEELNEKWYIGFE